MVPRLLSPVLISKPHWQLPPAPGEALDFAGSGEHAGVSAGIMLPEGRRWGGVSRRPYLGSEGPGQVLPGAAPCQKLSARPQPAAMRREEAQHLGSAPGLQAKPSAPGRWERSLPATCPPDFSWPCLQPEELAQLAVSPARWERAGGKSASLAEHQGCDVQQQGNGNGWWFPDPSPGTGTADPP